MKWNRKICTIDRNIVWWLRSACLFNWGCVVISYSFWHSRSEYSDSPQPLYFYSPCDIVTKTYALWHIRYDIYVVMTYSLWHSRSEYSKSPLPLYCYSHCDIIPMKYSLWHIQYDTYVVMTHSLWHCRMGWLRLVGSLKVQVSFAKESHKRDDILQKRPMILRSLLIVATP